MDNHVIEYISAYMDDELNHNETQSVEVHLQDCSACRQYLEELISIKEQMAMAYGSIQAPDTLGQSVMASIRQPQTAPKRQHSLTKWVIAVMSILIISIICIQMSPAVYSGFNFASTAVTITFSVLHSISLIISSIPSLLGVILAITLLIIALSVWSLHRLLETRAIFDE